MKFYGILSFRMISYFSKWFMYEVNCEFIGYNWINNIEKCKKQENWVYTQTGRTKSFKISLISFIIFIQIKLN